MLCGDLSGKEIQNIGYVCNHIAGVFALQQKLTYTVKQLYAKKINFKKAIYRIISLSCQSYLSHASDINNLLILRLDKLFFSS